MKIKIQTPNDTLSIRDGKVVAFAAGQEYVFELEQIEEVVVITTDMGPFYDDMCLAIRIDSETAIFIMSEHNMYKTFLFDQLGQAIELDYQQIIDAAMCKDNHVFVIYRRVTSV